MGGARNNNRDEPFCLDDPAAIGEEEDKDNEDSSKLPVVPKQRGLITLSNLPPAHWKNLFHLELIKERNKPTEAPQKPPSAPFFLQWREGEKQDPSGPTTQAG